MYTTLQRLMAAMAFDAYRPSPEENRINPASAGWSIDKLLSQPDRGDGFDATVYHVGDSQVVIAFRGTDNDNIATGLADWTDNAVAAAGRWSDQVQLAIETVADVIAKYPDADIQLTGHSLGGGLASLVAFFFDIPAFVFAPAPFALSAINRQATVVPPPTLLTFEDSDLVQEYFDHYRAYQRDKGRPNAIWEKFRDYCDAFASDVALGRQLFDSRQTRVTGTYIEGEVLEGLRTLLPTVGRPSDLVPIVIGDTSLSGDDGSPSALHGMLLHAALVNSDKLREASVNLSSLLELLGDKSLYAQANRGQIPGFLNQLISESIATTTGISKIDQFADDLLRLGAQGATQLGSLERGLIAAVSGYGGCG